MPLRECQELDGICHVSLRIDVCAIIVTLFSYVARAIEQSFGLTPGPIVEFHEVGRPSVSAGFRRGFRCYMVVNLELAMLLLEWPIVLVTK